MRGIIVALIFIMAAPAWGFRNDEPLKDPALEARALELFVEFRCLVCQNQAISESDADLARDLRLIVRERLMEGDTDDEVRAYLVERYGDFVLLRPPVKPTTYLLWFAPALIVVGAGYAVFSYFRRRNKADRPPVANLDADEQARLSAMLDRGDH